MAVSAEQRAERCLVTRRQRRIEALEPGFDDMADTLFRNNQHVLLPSIHRAQPGAFAGVILSAEAQRRKSRLGADFIPDRMRLS